MWKTKKKPTRGKRRGGAHRARVSRMRRNRLMARLWDRARVLEQAGGYSPFVERRRLYLYQGVGPD